LLVVQFLKPKTFESVINTSSTSKAYYYNPVIENNLRLITLHDSNTLRLINISVQKNNFMKNIAKTFSFSGGNINSTLIHPSDDYLIVLLGCNKIFIARIETGDICGEINLDTIAYDIRIDTSGLYLGVLVDEDNNKNKEMQEGNEKIRQSTNKSI
jgi:hypothetical protein